MVLRNGVDVRSSYRETRDEQQTVSPSCKTWLHDLEGRLPTPGKKAGLAVYRS